MKKKAPWSRTDKLTAVGVVIALLAIVVGLLFPEVRRFVGLEKPAPAPVAPTQVQAPTRGQNPAAPAPSSPANEITSKQSEPDKKKKSAPSMHVQVQGDHNVGGIITQDGSNNIAQIGNNNQATINPGSPEKNWVITQEICAKILAPANRAPQTHADVSIGAFISDPDGANVVGQLMRCLPNVPWWKVSGAVLPSVPDGVVIFTAQEDELNAESLGAGLQSAGFNAPKIQVSPNLKNEMDVSIGKHALGQP